MREITIELMVRDLVEKGFIHGWLNDRSEELIIDEISNWGFYIKYGIPCNRLLLFDIHICNLEMYCGWAKEETDNLCVIFNITKKDLDRFLRGDSNDI